MGGVGFVGFFFVVEGFLEIILNGVHSSIACLPYAFYKCPSSSSSWLVKAVLCVYRKAETPIL